MRTRRPFLARPSTTVSHVLNGTKTGLPAAAVPLSPGMGIVMRSILGVALRPGALRIAFTAQTPYPALGSLVEHIFYSSDARRPGRLPIAIVTHLLHYALRNRGPPGLTVAHFSVTHCATEEISILRCALEPPKLCNASALFCSLRAATSGTIASSSFGTQHLSRAGEETSPEKAPAGSAERG